jgi:transcriptional regulator of acetoin/glycerol metabolism
LVVGLLRAAWPLLEAHLANLGEPTVTWHPGERLVLPSPQDACTLVLYEVGCLSAQEQRELLTWMERAKRRIRVLATGSVGLYPRVDAGVFSETLYYRLNTMYFEFASTSDVTH